jgi:hypothetical protein
LTNTSTISLSGTNLNDQTNDVGDHEQDHVPFTVQQGILFAKVFDTETEEGVVECGEEARCENKTVHSRKVRG